MRLDIWFVIDENGNLYTIGVIQGGTDYVFQQATGFIYTTGYRSLFVAKYGGWWNREFHSSASVDPHATTLSYNA